jgi:2-amino-4-hydroxy-6-hydroxymethyldihydropteridine diphosphokinase
MLEELQEIEASFGRDRTRETRRGARTLDLDILLCGDASVTVPDLVIPHPHIGERLFVLVPLLELAPDLLDPRTGRPYQEAREALEREARGSGGVYLHTSAEYTGPSNTEA